MVSDPTYLPWAATWFDDSPRGETWGVSRESEVLCYTTPFVQGWTDADRIARAMGLLHQYESDHG